MQQNLPARLPVQHRVPHNPHPALPAVGHSHRQDPSLSTSAQCYCCGRCNHWQQPHQLPKATPAGTPPASMRRGVGSKCRVLKRTASCRQWHSTAHLSALQALPLQSLQTTCLESPSCAPLLLPAFFAATETGGAAAPDNLRQPIEACHVQGPTNSGCCISSSSSAEWLENASRSSAPDRMGTTAL
jgi:hypothetical protein